MRLPFGNLFTALAVCLCFPIITPSSSVVDITTHKVISPFLTSGAIHRKSFVGDSGFTKALYFVRYLNREHNLTYNDSDETCVVDGIQLRGEICFVHALLIYSDSGSNPSQINKGVSTPSCTCKLRFLTPLQGQVWLMDQIPFNISLIKPPNLDGDTSESCKERSLQGVYFSGTLFVASIQIDTGYIECMAMPMVPEDYGLFNLKYKAQEESAYGNKFLYVQSFPDEMTRKTSGCDVIEDASVWYRVKPFTRYDPGHIITVENLTSRQLNTQGRYAFATLLYDDGYLPGVMALGASLRGVGSAFPLICIVPINKLDSNIASLSDPPMKYSSRVSVSSSSINEMHRAGIKVEGVHWLDSNIASTGGALPSLGTGVWLKLRLWMLIQYDRIVYLDADTLVLHNIDELFTLTRNNHESFGAVGDYFAGAFFSLVPSVKSFMSMLEELTQSSGILDRHHDKHSKVKASEYTLPVTSVGRYPYGEQDFLNDFWRDGDSRLDSDGQTRRRVVLDYRYHCLAEDVGILDRDPVYTSSLNYSETMVQTCKIVEFSSCDIGGHSGVRWKPWMEANLLNGRPVCKNFPSEAFWELHKVWLSFYESCVK